jgi:hypothetical protein
VVTSLSFDAPTRALAELFVVTEPQVALTPATGPKGTTVMVSGQGFVPDERLRLVFQSQPASTSAGLDVVADDLGSFTAPLSVPGGAPPGGHLVVVTSASVEFSEPRAPAQLFVVTDPQTKGPVLRASPTSGPGGARVGLRALGFPPRELVSFSSTGSIEPIKDLRASSTGAVRTSFVVTSGDDPETIGVVASTRDGIHRPICFARRLPTVPASHAAGAIGTTITLTATGFIPGDPVGFSSPDLGPLSVEAADANGEVTALFGLPADDVATFVVVAESPAAPSPRISIARRKGTTTLSPSVCPGGGSVVIASAGLEPGERVSFSSVGGVPSIQDAQADPRGSIERSALVPVGDDPVTFTLALSQGGIALHQASFVRPQPGVTVRPLSGPGGTFITAVGSGFVPGSPVRVDCDACTGPALDVNTSVGGDFEVTLQVAASAEPESFDVRATNPAGNHAVMAFARIGTFTQSFVAVSDESVMTGDNVTLTAQVVSATADAPAGTVVFSDEKSELARAELDADGRAQVDVRVLRAGRHALTTHYMGNAVFCSSRSAPTTLTVEQSPI